MLNLIPPPLSAVEAYRLRKASLELSKPPRESCLRCRKPKVTCYCPQLASLVTDPRIVILMHPLEVRHPVGTGRMTHQCLTNSSLIVGVDFTAHKAVNDLITDPKLFPMVLFPGPKSLDLSALAPRDRRAHIPKDREPVIIVLDGTWHLARKMLHRSPNLQRLPRLSFTPSRPSGFLVRKQPHAQCFSTIEAVHELLTLLTPEGASRPFDILLDVFDEMVAKQLSFHGTGPSRHSLNYAARKLKKKAISGSV